MKNRPVQQVVFFHILAIIACWHRLAPGIGSLFSTTLVPRSSKPCAVTSRKKIKANKRPFRKAVRFLTKKKMKNLQCYTVGLDRDGRITVDTSDASLAFQGQPEGIRRMIGKPAE